MGRRTLFVGREGRAHKVRATLIVLFDQLRARPRGGREFRLRYREYTGREPEMQIIFLPGRSPICRRRVCFWLRPQG